MRQGGDKDLLSDQDTKGSYDVAHVDGKSSNTGSKPNESRGLRDTPTWTVEEAIEKGGFGKFQWMLLCFTGCIWAADAMEMMFISFVVPILRREWDLEAPWDAAIGIIVFAGMGLGAFFWSMQADLRGRRPVLIITNLMGAFFGLLCGFAPNLAWLLIFRFFVGFAIGGSGVAYTLFAEYAPSTFRGKALIIEQGFWSGGALLSVALAWAVLANMDESVGWRWYVSLSTIPLWIIVCLSGLVPESARYYSASEQWDKATETLKRMYEINGIPFLEGEIKRTPQSSKRAQICDLFVPAYKKTSIILLISFFFWTFCYYGICFLSDRVFEGDGDLYMAMFVTTLSEIPGLFVGMFLLDYTGRKGMMNICWLAFAICALLLAITDRSGNDIVLVFIGRGFVSLGFYVLFIYFAEYYPTVIRSTALGTGSAIARVAGMVTTYIAEDLPVGTANAIYAGSAAFSLGLGLMLPGDTTGKPMEDYVNRSPVELEVYAKQEDTKRLMYKTTPSSEDHLIPGGEDLRVGI